MEDGLKGLLQKPPYLLGTRAVYILAWTITFDFNVMKTTQKYIFLGRTFYYQSNAIYL